MEMIIVWAVVIVVMVVAEIATTALVSIWFIGGGLAALILALLHVPVWVQITAFIGVSVVLFVFFREWLQSHFSPCLIPTNADRLIGAIGTVTQTIEPQTGGRVLVGGQDWKAMSVRHERIAEGEMVKVCSISGVKVLVMHVPNMPGLPSEF